MHKCHKCVFKDVFRDQDKNVPICRRCEGLQDAIRAYNSEGPCQWYISWQELMGLQERMAAKKQSAVKKQNTSKWEWSGDMCDA